LLDRRGQHTQPWGGTPPRGTKISSNNQGLLRLFEAKGGGSPPTPNTPLSMLWLRPEASELLKIPPPHGGEVLAPPAPNLEDNAAHCTLHTESGCVCGELASSIKLRNGALSTFVSESRRRLKQTTRGRMLHTPRTSRRTCNIDLEVAVSAKPTCNKRDKQASYAKLIQ
jgi:hypothetical protein